jgi:HTH-type transcriptional regulator / antitoxin HipB
MNEFAGFEERVRTAADLGKAARKRRREQKLTQEDVALLVGSHRNRIQEVERGAPTERLELLFRVLNELGLDLIVRPRDAHRGADR